MNKNIYASLSVCAAISAVVMAGCANDVASGSDDEESVGEVSSPIVDGTKDKKAHPSVGGMIGPRFGTLHPRCSGTLISPKVFLTAGHCNELPGMVVDDIATITFDSQYIEGKSKTYKGKFIQHPQYNWDVFPTDVHDVAVIVFDKPIKGIEPSRVALPGALERQKRLFGGQTTLVGYGFQKLRSSPDELPGGDYDHDGGRYYTTGPIYTLDPFFLYVSKPGQPGGVCYGDSGGPVFLGAGRTERNVVAGVITDTDPTGGCVEFRSQEYRIDTVSARAFIKKYVRLADDENGCNHDY